MKSSKLYFVQTTISRNIAQASRKIKTKKERKEFR